MQISTDNSLIKQFSGHLFWDTDPTKLSLEKHRKYIVRRVVSRGATDDWRLLLRCYTLETIIQTAQGLRWLDPKTLAFLSCVGGVPRESFRCYTLTRSSEIHWVS